MKRSRFLSRIDNVEFSLKFIYSEKAAKFCEISNLFQSVCTVDKSKVEISQNFVAFSEYMNFKENSTLTMRERNLERYILIPTPPNSEIICGQNVGTKVVCGMILFFEKKAMLKI